MSQVVALIPWNTKAWRREPSGYVLENLRTGETPLYKAAEKCNVQAVKLLLQTPGIDVNKPDNKGVTPYYRLHNKLSELSFQSIHSNDKNAVPGIMLLWGKECIDLLQRAGGQIRVDR